MAYTYQYTKNGTNTVLTVYKDSNVIYQESSPSIPRTQLLAQAKIDLQERFPDSVNMTEELSQSQISQISDPNFRTTSTSRPPAQLTQNIPTKPPPSFLVPKEPSTATGLNKLSSGFSNKMIEVQSKINDFYYGKPEAKNKSIFKLKNPLSYGLKPLLDLIGSIDLCNIVNFALNSVSNTKPFNPEDKSKTNTPLGKVKYDIQYFAYEVQVYIDDFYAKYGNVESIINRTALQQLATDLSSKTSALINSGLLRDPLITSAFPQLNILSNFIDNSVSTYNKYTNLRSLPIAEVQKFIKFIDNVRKTAVAIQALNNPANLIAFADTFLDDKIAKQIEKLNKIIDPKKIQNAIKKIIDVCQKILTIIDTVLRIVGILKLVTRIITIVYIVIQNIRFFIKGLPVPSIFTTVSIQQTLADVNSTVLVTTGNKFLDRIKEINNILSTVYNIFTDISIKLRGIIDGLKLIILNLQNCEPLKNDPSIKEIKNQLDNTVKNLETANDQILKFIKTYDDNKKRRRNSFGKYTIKILTEELVDESLTLKRRFGVALDSNDIAVAQSTPTFASDDNIIIQEVKLLLISKNLVKSRAGITSVDVLETLEEVSNFVDSDEIDFSLPIDALDSYEQDPSLDAPDNEDDESEDNLGLNAFINKIKGGKRLRRRMRSALAKARQKLNEQNQRSDPTGRFTGQFSQRNAEKAKQEEAAALTEKIKEQERKIQNLEENTILPKSVRIIRLRPLYKELNEMLKKLEQLTGKKQKERRLDPSKLR